MFLAGPCATELMTGSISLRVSSFGAELLLAAVRRGTNTSTSVNLQFAKLERRFLRPVAQGMRMRNRIFCVYVHRASLGI